MSVPAPRTDTNVASLDTREQTVLYNAVLVSVTCKVLRKKKKREEEYKIREDLLDDKQTKEYATLNSLNGFFFS